MPESELFARAARSTWAAPATVFLAALAAFGVGLAGEPHFADESAYVSQAYYAGLFASGRWNDPAWLEYMAFDLPPLPKYLIGGAFAAGGFPTPGPADARAWYGDIHRRFETPASLTAARIPTAVVGALGCVAVYGLGTLASGRRVGAVAAALLAANPLYRMSARRAMSDVPCEAFLLAGLFLALVAWTSLVEGRLGKAAWVAAAGSGAAIGLSLLSKLSGTLALMVVAAWVVLALGLAISTGRKAAVAAAAVVVGLAASGTFLALNPFPTASPSGGVSRTLAPVAAMGVVERIRMTFRLRLEVSESQQSLFPHNALKTPAARAATVAVQGFGRFGPFGPSHTDSVRWLDPRQDLGAALWLPWVGAGAFCTWRVGNRQRRDDRAPAAWAVLAHFAVAVAVVTAYIPMAWDRYQLAVQAPAALLAAVAAVAAWDGFRAVRRPSTTVER